MKVSEDIESAKFSILTESYECTMMVVDWRRSDIRYDNDEEVELEALREKKIFGGHTGVLSRGRENVMEEEVKFQ